MNSIEMADKLADALRMLLAECDTNMGFATADPAHAGERQAMREGMATLEAYERSQTERVARDKYAKRMFSRQYR